MNSARRAFAFSFTAQYLVLALQFIATIVVARLLLPEEIGTYSVGAAFVALGQILRDFGTGQYIIQEKDLTIDRIRAAFTLTLILGFTIGSIVFLIAPFVGNFYQKEGITQIISLLSLNFALLPFGTITAAYLRREMNFKPIMQSQVGAALIQVVVTISCAVAGLSYMSMAWGGLANTVTTIIFMIYYRPSELPKLPGIRELHRVVLFGSKLSLVDILVHIGASVPELILGKTLGMHTVGIFSRAVGTIQLFGNLVLRGATPVINPLFAEKSRRGDDLKKSYLTAVSYITGIAWPFFGVLLLTAKDLTLALFGSNWLEIVPIIQVLCVAQMVHHLSSLAEQVFTATGNVDKLLRFSLTMQPIRIIGLGISSFISLQAVAVTFLMFPILRSLLLWRPLFTITGAGVKDYVRVIITSGKIGLFTTLSVLIDIYILNSYDMNNPYFVLGSVFVIASMTWLLTIIISNHPILLEVAGLAKHIHKKLQS